MRALAWFLGSIIAAGIAAALLAYPAFALSATFADFAFHRVASRIAMLILAIELIWLARRFGIRRKPDFGYGLPRRRFAAQAALWTSIGVLSAIPGAWFMWATKIRILEPGLSLNAALVAHFFAVGMGSGFAVALLEETVFRGGLHTAIERETGPLAAALLSAPIFAVLHFFAKVRIPADQIGWFSGFDLIALSFAPLAHPFTVADSFLAWLVVGLILSLTRVLTGNIAVAIGLHAGWVVVLRMMQQGTVRGPPSSFDAFVGKFDGLVGYWILPWGLLVAALLWSTRAVWVPAAKNPPGAVN